MKNNFCLKLYHLLFFSIVLGLVSCGGKGETDAGKVTLNKAPDSIVTPPPITLSNCFYTLYTTTKAFYDIPSSISRIYFTYNFSSTGIPLLNGWSLKSSNQFDNTIPLVKLLAANGTPTNCIPINESTSFGNLALKNPYLNFIQSQYKKFTYVIFTPVLSTDVPPNPLASIYFKITFSNSIPTNAPLPITTGGVVPLQADDVLNPSPPRDY